MPFEATQSHLCVVLNWLQIEPECVSCDSTVHNVCVADEYFRDGWTALLQDGPFLPEMYCSGYECRSARLLRTATALYLMCCWWHILHIVTIPQLSHLPCGRVHIYPFTEEQWSRNHWLLPLQLFTHKVFQNVSKTFQTSKSATPGKAGFFVDSWSTVFICAPGFLVICATLSS